MHGDHLISVTSAPTVLQVIGALVCLLADLVDVDIN